MQLITRTRIIAAAVISPLAIASIVMLSSSETSEAAPKQKPASSSAFLVAPQNTIGTSLPTTSTPAPVVIGEPIVIVRQTTPSTTAVPTTTSTVPAIPETIGGLPLCHATDPYGKGCWLPPEHPETVGMGEDETEDLNGTDRDGYIEDIDEDACSPDNCLK